MLNILKCKMCGGDIEVNQDMTVGKCLFCGSTMTLPRIDSDKKARLFNRANEYRLNNEFDKAYDAYKTITEEDEQEAEAYWGMILSEYGVEYVEDPKTANRVPTCHRTQVQSILDNTNFSLALKYSSGESRLMYQDEAEELDKLQRKIISISSRQEPYDVFICYKETDDETGERTKDSVLAEDIFNELEKQNIRVFFSRISLEEHLGENYEPFIYSALKSAKVMLVVSTTTDNCEAVWVKNEWSRFLRFMEDYDSKAVIPVYRDMNAYDFPNALSKFQMQDMDKIGAINDLVRGIKKILGQTNAVSRNYQLDALLVDKLERDERKKKSKIVLIIACAILIPAILGFLGYKIISTIQSKVISTEVTSGFPDSKKYDSFTVYLNDGNFEEYVETYQVSDSGGKIIVPKGIEKGWIVIYSEHTEKIKGTHRINNGGRIITNTFENGYLYGFGLDDSMVLTGAEGTITFISTNCIKEWSTDGYSLYIKIPKFYKKQLVVDLSNRGLEEYVIPMLGRYLPEKRVYK